MCISRPAGLAILLVGVVLSSLVLYPMLQRGVTVGDRHFELPGVATRQPQLSAYGDDWNDLSSFREALAEDYNVTAILSNPAVIGDVAEPNRTLLVVAGAEKGYSSLEVQVIVNYLKAGGRLLVMGDFDYSNDLAEPFGVSYARLTLWNEKYRDNVSMVEVEAYLAQGGIERNYTLLLNTPTALYTGETVTTNVWDVDSDGIQPAGYRILARSDEQSWLDSDGDGVITPDDEVGPFDLVVDYSVADSERELGRAVFLGDASLAINRMWERADNAEFLLALVAYLLPDGGTVIFDESRHTQDSFGASLFQAAIGFYFLLSGEIIMLQFLRFIVVLMGGYLTLMFAVRQSNPQRWQHIYDLHRPRPLRATGDLVNLLRGVLLERMRLKYSIHEFDGLAPPQRAALAPQMVKRYNVLLDGELAALLYSPERVVPQDLRRLAQKVQKWSL